MKNPKVALILGMRAKAKKDEETEEGAEEDTSSMAFDSAAQELFDAVKADDVEAFKSALKSAVEACKYGEE